MALSPSVPDAQNPTQEPSARLHPLAIGIGFTVLCLSFMLNAMDRQVFYPLLPEIRKEFGFTLEESGFLATGFTLGLAVAGFLSGFVVDRYSRKTVIVVSVLVYSAGTAAIPLATGIADMTVYRILSGVGEGVQATALYAIVGSLFFRRRAFAAGFIGVAFGGGVFFGPMVGVPFAHFMGTWKAAFLLFGSLGVLMTLLIVVTVTSKMTDIRGGSANTNFSTQDYSHVPATVYNRNTLLFGFAAAASGMIFYGFIGLYPTFLREQLGFDAGQATVAVSMAGLGAMSAVLTGWLGDVMSQKWLLTGTFLLTSVVAWLTYGVVANPAGQYTLAFLMGVLASGSLFTNVATAMQRSVRPASIGRGQGLFMLTYYVPAAFSGLLFARLVSTSDWAAAGLWQLSALALAAAFVLLFVDTRRMIGGLPRPAPRPISSSKSS